jgi:hypothetical protein
LRSLEAAEARFAGSFPNKAPSSARVRQALRSQRSGNIRAAHCAPTVTRQELCHAVLGLQASDDFRLKLYPRAQSQQQRAYIDYEVSTTSTILNPTSIVVGYEGSASSVNVLRTMYAYDYVAGAWVQVSQSQSTTLETTQEVALTNPARFVSASGQMRVRVRNIANGPIFGFPYETATDWVYWRLTQ